MSGQGVAKQNTRLPGHPETLKPVDLQRLNGPQYIVTVDTEEEFDWAAPFSRDGYGTRHVPQIATFQTLCDQHGVQPIYLVDYPIAADAAAVDLLGEIQNSGRGEIGAQLHSWMTPPFDEDVTAYNSYACNLPADLEAAKLRTLCAKINTQFGSSPLIYRAGRYGAGPDTMPVLHELGFRIDSSVRSLFDYQHQGGPDYSQSALEPYWLIDSQLIELPLTSVFAGSLKIGGKTMFGSMFTSDTSRSLLARTGLLERVALTPEGIPVHKAIEAIDLALDMGLPVLNFSFHSPSLEPGHTPYVRTEEDLERFYTWWQQVFAHLEKRSVHPTTAKKIVEAAF
jgi:hypothetical protein